MSQEDAKNHEEASRAGNEEPTEEVSSFIDLYKYSHRTSSFTQEKRRELFLQKQKEKRCEAFDEKRDLSDLFIEDSPEELMECEFSKVAKPRKKFPFGYKLMKAEWLIEVPEDLAENWLVKLCPEGTRFIIVANRAITTCYFMNGKPSFKFKSNLPGGSPETCSNRFTILDCVLNKNIFLVYDVLAWNSTSLINAETQMRFFWLKSKFQEDPELSKTKHPKNYRFLVVDFFPAQIALVQDQLFMPFTLDGNELTLEGVLFYHKEGHYVSGPCPLVGWLKTFMLPEILHVDVPASYTQNKPENYESLQVYLKSKKKHKRRQKTHIATMETEQIETEEVEDIECDTV